MKKNILFIIITLILILIFTACTENGVECSLTGKWSITDFDHDDLIADVDDVEGILEITYNDTFEVEMEIKLKNGIKADIDDYGTLKACAYNKFIQFFSDDDDGDVVFTGSDDTTNCRYTLNSNNLTIYNDDFTMELTKTYQ